MLLPRSPSRLLLPAALTALLVATAPAVTGTTAAALVTPQTAPPAGGATAPAFTPARATVKAQDAEPVAPTLVAEHEAVVPGAMASLGVRLRMASGWHVYSAARNDSGLPVLVKPEFPAGWVPGPLQWPTPVRYLSPGPLLDHVYEGEVLLPFAVQVPADAQPGDRIVLAANLEWMACKDVCVADGERVELTVVVAEPGSRPAAGAHATLFAAARARLPEPWPAAPPAPGGEGALASRPAAAPAITAQWQDAAVTLRAPGAGALTLLPAEDCVELPALAEEGTATGEVLRLHPARELRADARLKGSVEVRYPPDEQGLARTRIFALDLPLPPSGSTPTPASDLSPVSPTGEPR